MAIAGANLGQPTLPAPQSIANFRLIGITHINSFLHAFTLVEADGSDETTLWSKLCIDGTWQTDWVSLGQPAGGISFAGTRQGMVVTAGAAIWVFVCGQDGHLYCNLWNGLAWTWCDMGMPLATKIDFVDSVAPSPFVVTTGVAGAAWGAYWNGVSWLWQLMPGIVFQNRTNSILYAQPSDDFIVLFQLDTDGNLICGANMDAGIKTSGKVNFGGCVQSGVGVKGRNVDGTSAVASLPETDSPADRILDLRDFSDFKSGAFCWAFVETDAVHSYPACGGRESEANFNFDPDSGPGSVGYMISTKGDNYDSWFTFSSCSQC